MARKGRGPVDIGRLASEAIQSKDDVGIVLRLHGITEARLRTFVECQLVGGRERYIEAPRYFGDALALAVAFGLPLPSAEVCRLLNRIRNDVAHDCAVAMTESRVRDFCDAVSRVVEVSPGCIGLGLRPTYAQLADQPGAEARRQRFVVAFFGFFIELNKWLEKATKRRALAQAVADR